MNIVEIKNAVLPACREFGVRRLDAFGSVARGTTSSSSDVDLLVEFDAPDRSPAKRFFGLLHRLEDTLGCDVDLLTSTSLKNPYFRKRVLSERVPIYEG
ncbi:MAG: nucleotidyltransferase family protein [Lentisphaeria bacterium]|nr:nucleotidyltransferase family protein [Lentisphaeria bacterium]